MCSGHGTCSDGYAGDGTCTCTGNYSGGSCSISPVACTSAEDCNAQATGTCSDSARSPDAHPTEATCTGAPTWQSATVYECRDSQQNLISGVASAAECAEHGTVWVPGACAQAGSGAYGGPAVTALNKAECLRREHLGWYAGGCFNLRSQGFPDACTPNPGACSDSNHVTQQACESANAVWDTSGRIGWCKDDSSGNISDEASSAQCGTGKTWQPNSFFQVRSNFHGLFDACTLWDTNITGTNDCPNNLKVSPFSPLHIACSNAAHSTQANCESAGATWGPTPICSNPAITRQNNIATDIVLEHALNNGACSDAAHVTKSGCMSAEGTWTPLTSENCTTSTLSWTDGICKGGAQHPTASLRGQPLPNQSSFTEACSNNAHDTKAACESAGALWTSAACDVLGTTWTAQSVQQCTDSRFSSSSDCSNGSLQWTSANDAVTGFRATSGAGGVQAATCQCNCVSGFSGADCGSGSFASGGR